MSYLPNVDVERLKEAREAWDDDFKHQEDRVHHRQLEQGGRALDELGVVLVEGVDLHPKGSRRQAVHRETSKQFLKSSIIRYQDEHFPVFPHLAIHLLSALPKVTKLLDKMVGGDLDEAQHALHLPACEDRAERASHLHPGLVSFGFRRKLGYTSTCFHSSPFRLVSCRPQILSYFPPSKNVSLS